MHCTIDVFPLRAKKRRKVLIIADTNIAYFGDIGLAVTVSMDIRTISRMETTFRCVSFPPPAKYTH